MVSVCFQSKTQTLFDTHEKQKQTNIHKQSERSKRKEQKKTATATNKDKKKTSTASNKNRNKFEKNAGHKTSIAIDDRCKIDWVRVCFSVIVRNGSKS